MKRIVLSLCVMGVLAGQASAVMYIPPISEIRNWTLVGNSADTLSSRMAVYNRNGTLVDGTATGYNWPMSGMVGFVGMIGDTNQDQQAWLRIGGAAASGTCDSLYMYVQNDDQSLYRLGLFATDGTNTYLSSDPLPVFEPHQGQWMTLTFPQAMTDPTVGFELFMDLGLSPQHGYTVPSAADIWYVSATPLPGAVLLGFLGLGAAGLGLRKLA